MHTLAEPTFDTRERLIAAAARAFFEHGYSVSMEAVAVRAGVAKQTLYNHFAGKDELFQAVVAVGSARVVTALADQGTLRERLVRFARTFRSTVLGEECIALYRMMVAESTRFPQVCQGFYDAGPGHALRQLSDLIEREMHAGRLRDGGSDVAAEARFAADMLLGMLTGVERTRILLGVSPTGAAPGPDLAEHIVDCFLRAFGVGPHPENRRRS